MGLPEKRGRVGNCKIKKYSPPWVGIKLFLDCLQQSKIDNRCRKEMKNMHHAISKSNKMHIKGEKKMMKKKKKKREKKIFKLR